MTVRAVDSEITPYFAVPWSIVPSKGEDGNVVLRITELPDFIVVGRSPDLDAMFFDALESFIGSYLEFGDTVPLPAGWAGEATTKLPAATMPARQGAADIAEPETRAWPSRATNLSPAFATA